MSPGGSFVFAHFWALLRFLLGIPFFINHSVFLLIYASRGSASLSRFLEVALKAKIINKTPANHKSELVEMRGFLWYNNSNENQNYTEYTDTTGDLTLFVKFNLQISD